jgi:hypothetical protein
MGRTRVYVLWFFPVVHESLGSLGISAIEVTGVLCL